MRQRIQTKDDDFLDLDWLKQGNDRLVILSHGLEGHSQRPYMLGMASYASMHNWDVLAWNYRGCSGVPNLNLYAYHSGKTEDLADIIEHAATHGYREIALIGFSIGGNITLLHLGRDLEILNPAIVAAVAISVPCDLQSTSEQLAKKQNHLYMKNFLLSFEQKLKEKQRIFPEQIDLSDFKQIRNFKDFDERYTAPMNGFNSAEEYWQKSSSLQYLNSIKTPCMILNAKDDPFLTKSCFPYAYCSTNPFLTLIETEHGGHLGFMPGNQGDDYFSEQCALAFLNTHSQSTSA